MHVDVWLAGNVPLGIFMSLMVAALLYANRIFVRDMLTERDPGWRQITQIAGVLVAAVLAWGTFADNWRQIVDLPYRLSQRFPSKRVEFEPTPEALRAVTFALVIASFIPVAALFSRHVGGYIVQLVTLVGAIVFWAPLFAMRQRLDINLALGFGGDLTSISDLLGYAFYLCLDWLAVSLIVIASYIGLAMLVALPTTLILDLTRLRQPRPTGEATAFFANLGQRAATLGHER